MIGALVGLLACTSDPDQSRIPATGLRVVNDSDRTIVEIYLASEGSPTWGRNRLGDSPLAPGEEILLGARCGVYDALLVDGDGGGCELRDLELCRSEPVWVIDDETCRHQQSLL